MSSIFETSESINTGWITEMVENDAQTFSADEKLAEFMRFLNTLPKPNQRQLGFEQKEFTSNPGLFTERALLLMLSSLNSSEELRSYSLSDWYVRKSALHLLQNLHCHSDVLNEVLESCLKEVNGHSYLKRLSAHKDKQVRFYGLLLTTGLLSRKQENRELLNIIQNYSLDEFGKINSLAAEVMKSMRPLTMSSSSTIRISLSLPDYSEMDRTKLASPWFHGMCNTRDISIMQDNVDELKRLIFKTVKRSHEDDDHEASQDFRRMRI